MSNRHTEIVHPRSRAAAQLAVGLFVWSTGLCAAGAEHDQVVQIHVDSNTIISHIADDFIGFGYEKSAVAQSQFFSDKNAEMVRLYNNLSSHGLIRIGGNISDHTRYDPAASAVVNAQTAVTVINRSNLDDLGRFARATGWAVMWGLNLGTDSKREAVAEAVDVKAAIGSQLHSFEIGNEVEALPRFKGSYDDYHAAYVDYKSAVRSAMPKAAFSGPDSIGNLQWIARFANTESGDIRLLTQHYYRGGAGSKSATLETLLATDAGWAKRLTNLQELCGTDTITYRINETNSFSGGGKAGVSDTFGAALWCLDYLFLLATHRCAGVNMETDINQHAWISHYSPIVHDAAGKCSARAEYYGMLAFSLAGQGDLLKLDLDKADINLTAYATRDERGSVWITAVNKELSQDAIVELALPEGYLRAEAFRLSAPSVNSTDHITFAGAEVSGDGSWSIGESEKLAIENATVRLTIPRCSAVVIRVQRPARN